MVSSYRNVATNGSWAGMVCSDRNVATTAVWLGAANEVTLGGRVTRRGGVLTVGDR